MAVIGMYKKCKKKSVEKEEEESKSAVEIVQEMSYVKEESYDESIKNKTPKIDNVIESLGQSNKINAKFKYS